MRTTTEDTPRCFDISSRANRLILSRFLFPRIVFFLFAWIVALSAAPTWADTGHSDVAAEMPGHAIQTECPVMVGNKIDPSIYTDYKGNRVFFCCPSCKTAFAKNPEKYLPRLPQFTSNQAKAGRGEHENGVYAREFSLMSLIEPSGILTLSLVALTVCLGLLRRVRRLKPRLILTLHKTAGVLTLLSGIIHATTVFLAH